MSTIRNRKVIGKRKIQQSTSAVCCVFGYHSILLSYSCLWATGTYNTYICCKRRRKTFQTDSIWVLSASQTKHNSAFRTSQIGQVNHVQVRYRKRRKRKRREFPSQNDSIVARKQQKEKYKHILELIPYSGILFTSFNLKSMWLRCACVHTNIFCWHQKQLHLSWLFSSLLEAQYWNSLGVSNQQIITIITR